MNSKLFDRMPEWRNLVWMGVVGSAVAWGVAWLIGGGWYVLMALVALAGVPFALWTMRGMRLATAGLVIVGLTLLFGSVLSTALTLLGGVDVVRLATLSVAPMVFAIVLLLGAVPGFTRTGTRVTPDQPATD